MPDVHIRGDLGSKSEKVIICPRCDRRNLILKLGEKFVLGQRCSNCWYVFK